MKVYKFTYFPLYSPSYMSREPFLALTDLSWVTNHFSDITDTHVNCLHLDLDFKDMWSNLLIMYGTRAEHNENINSSIQSS